MTLSFLLLCSQHFFPYFRRTRVWKRHCGIRCQVLLVSHSALRNKTKLSLYNAGWACSHLACMWTTYPLNWSMLDIYTIMTTLVPAGQISTIKIIGKCHYCFARTVIINEDTSLPADLCWPSLIQIPFLKRMEEGWCRELSGTVFQTSCFKLYLSSRLVVYSWVAESLNFCVPPLHTV